MNILITGGAGFIGSSLAGHLLEQGHHVMALDNLSTGRKTNIEAYEDHANFSFYEGSATDTELMESAVKWCDHCYHLGAPVGVKYIMANPIKTILDNIRCVDVVLEMVNKYKKRVLIASTSEIYGKNLDLLDDTGTHKLKETDYRVEGPTRNHRWAYANTKAMDEFLAFAYYKEHGTEIVISRFFNTVGPRQLSNYGMVIPNFVQRTLTGEDVTIYGSGMQKRSFCHVNDAIRAVTGLMFTGKGIGEEFNIGNPNEITINELAERIIQKTGSNSKIVHIPYKEAYGSGFEDMNRRTADITKLRNTLDFELEYELDDILDDIISYHRSRLGVAS